jgi:CheY-like chemotaxis protein
MAASVVASGPDALASIEAGRFDVAVIDADLPGAGGVALARAIRLRPWATGLPIALVSGAGERHGDGQFDARLTRPIKPAPFVEVMLRLLGTAAAHDGAPAAEAPAVAPSSPGLVLVDGEALVPPPSLSAERVLVAEDNLVNQKVALRLLRSLGWEADLAGDGRQALDLLERAPYDIVLLDVQMPEVDGLEVARTVVRRWPDPAARPWLIACTANAMHGDEQVCRDAGMDDYLSKPVRRSELLAGLLRARAGLAGRRAVPLPSRDGTATQAIA